MTGGISDVMATSPHDPAQRHVAEEIANDTDSRVVVKAHRVERPKRMKPELLYQDDATFDSEPLVDTTAALTLRSKKTARLQKKSQKREAKRVHSEIKSFLDLPHELLQEVFSFLQPSDVFKLMLVSQATNQVISENEASIAQSIISRRYWILSRCFRRPFDLADVAKEALPALLSRQWQDRLRIHKNPYQHIKPIDPTTVCTCMSCVLAWNNLNIILDLGHWQGHLERREPLPIVPRGKRPEWNEDLLRKHAEIVSKAMHSPLTYARILQIHLQTTSQTILRSSRWRKKGEKLNPNKPRLYHMTDAELASGTDEYLARSGPPSYQPLFMRDNYYSVEAFVPNRKWDKEQQRWMYYSNWPLPHEQDLAWVMQRFTPQVTA
jgi:hypothetical protein